MHREASFIARTETELLVISKSVSTLDLHITVIVHVVD